MLLVTAPAATAAEINVSVPPIPLPPLPAGTPSAPPALPIAGAAPRAVGARGRCRGAGARAAGASSRRLRRALLCLINRERARNGRHRFGADHRLARAARRHAADMARRNYFGHVSPGGSSPQRRARAAGWPGGVGEAIAWNCGALATPRATLNAWLASPPHRAIVLGGARAVGVGVKRARHCGAGSAYWVADVG
jgi:uncharacterized protein YkwD